MMKFLTRLGGRGLGQLLVLEIDLNGTVYSISQLAYRNKRLHLHRFQTRPENWPAELRQAGWLPILIALRLENPFEKEVPHAETQPLQAVLGIGDDPQADFVYQWIRTEGHAFVAVQRKETMALLWEQLMDFQSQVLYVCLSQRVSTLLLPRKEALEKAVLAQQLQIPEAALYPYAVGFHYWKQQGQDLFGWAEQLASPGVFHQQKRWVQIGLKGTLLMGLLSSIGLGTTFYLKYQTKQLETQFQDREPQRIRIQSQAQQIARLQSQLDQYAQQRSQGAMSFLLDRTLRHCPAGIQLSDWQAPPREKALKGLRMDYLDELPHLLLQGRAQSPGEINQFADSIQQIPTVRLVQVAPTDFQYFSQHYVFALLVWLR